MKRAIFYILSFVGGGLVGGALSYYFTKKKLDSEHADEMCETREYYENIISSIKPEESVTFDKDPKDIAEKESIAREAAAEKDDDVDTHKTRYSEAYKKKKKPEGKEETPSEKPYLSDPKPDSLLISTAQYNNSDYDKLIMDWYKGNSYLDIRDWGIAGQLQAEELTDAYYEIKGEVEKTVARAIRDGTIQKTIYIRNSRRSEEYKVTIYETSYEE
jgi:hypothetical protein